MIRPNESVILLVFCTSALASCASLDNAVKGYHERKQANQQQDFVECYEANISRVKVTKTVQKVDFEECLEYAESKSHAEEKLILETINQLTLTEASVAPKQVRPVPRDAIKIPLLDPSAIKDERPNIKLLPIKFNQPVIAKAPPKQPVLARGMVKPEAKPVAKTFPYVVAKAVKPSNDSIALPSVAAGWDSGANKRLAKATRVSYSRQQPQSTDTALKDVWSVIDRGYQFKPHTRQRRVQALIRTYTKRPRRLGRLTQKATPFLPLILKEIMDRGMPTEIALLPFVESGFSTTALSHANAAGLWQFIPATGKRYGLQQNKTYDGRLNILASTTAALDYLEDLHKQFDGDWLLALAAYNAGEGRVAKAVARQLAKNGKTDFWSLKLPTETMLYVPRLLAYKEIMSKPQQYGFVRANPSPETALSSLRIQSKIDLQSITRNARLPSKYSLIKFNPSFLTGKIAPEYANTILVPKKYIGQIRSAVRLLSI